MLKETKNCWFCNIYCTTSFEQIHCSLSSTTNSRTKTELTRLDNQKERNNIISTYFFHWKSCMQKHWKNCMQKHRKNCMQKHRKSCMQKQSNKCMQKHRKNCIQKHRKNCMQKHRKQFMQKYKTKRKKITEYTTTMSLRLQLQKSRRGL